MNRSTCIPLSCCSVVLILASACDSGDTPGDTGPGAECVPSRAEWDSSINELVTAQCGTCHGEMPNFGAPVSLVSYEALLDGAEGERLVDHLVTRVADGTMPPTGAAQPALSERDAITAWASCGEVRVEDPVGLDANRPVFRSPEEAPAGLEVIDMTAEGLSIGPSQVDRYVDLDFTELVTEDMFIRRFEAIVDDSRVLHHLTLRRGNTSSGVLEYLYAWAPGTGAFEFPDGGVRLTPGDELLLQIHYNNGAAYDDVSDSSGVRLYIAPVEGPEYMMADPGPGIAGINVPPRSAATAEQSCIVREPVQILATMPHMHEIGAGFELDLHRGAGRLNLLRLGGWDFETQLFYDLPIALEEGDELVVRCDYVNPSDTEVRAGLRTEDEMCYAFTYVTPPNPGFCGAVAGDLEYVPGACVSEPLEVTPQTATVTEDPLAFDEAGVLAEGHWPATRAVIVTNSAGLVSIANFTVAGQLANGPLGLEGDASMHVIAPFGMLREGLQTDVSFAGLLDAAAGPSTVTATCGAAADARVGTVDGVPALAIAIPAESAMVDLELWIFFEGD